MGIENYSKIYNSPEFKELKRSKAIFIWPTVILFFCLYLTFPLMSAYAKPVMSKFVFGNIFFGYIMGVALYFLVWFLGFLYFFKAKKYDKQAEMMIQKYSRQKGA